MAFFRHRLGVAACLTPDDSRSGVVPSLRVATALCLREQKQSGGRSNAYVFI